VKNSLTSLLQQNKCGMMHNLELLEYTFHRSRYIHIQFNSIGQWIP